MMHVDQAQTRTPDPWALFGTDLEPAHLPVVADVDEAPREVPHARITLRAVDGGVAVTVAAAWIMLAFLSLVGMFIGWTTDASTLVIGGGCVLVAARRERGRCTAGSPGRWRNSSWTSGGSASGCFARTVAR